MSQTTSIADFSTGNDVKLVLMFGILGRIDLKHVISFHATQGVKQIRVERLGNTPLGADLPNGWNGSFGLDRGDSAADNLASTIETMYWNNQPLPSGQIYQYVTEPDGSTSTYLFDGVTLNLTDAGNWVQDQAVKQTISFFAGRRRRL